MSKKFFEIDPEHKTFIFTRKNFEELFIENSPANKAFKAAMSLGCYEGYIPVEGKKRQNPNRNTAAQRFNDDGVLSWLKDNAPSYIPKWEAMKELRRPNNSKYPFMIRKNVFLFDNPEARAFCGMSAETCDNYTLTKSGTTLNDAVSKRIASKND